MGSMRVCALASAALLLLVACRDPIPTVPVQGGSGGEDGAGGGTADGAPCTENATVCDQACLDACGCDEGCGTMCCMVETMHGVTCRGECVETCLPPSAGDAGEGEGGGGPDCSCACDTLTESGGCADFCDAAAFGSGAPNFCNGAPASAECASCLTSACGLSSEETTNGMLCKP